MTITTTDPNRALWEARAHGEETPTWESLASEPDGIEQDTVDVPAGLWLRPPDAVTGPATLAIHGGGFVSGSVATHRRMFGHLARSAGQPAGGAVARRLLDAYVLAFETADVKVLTAVLRADATLELLPGRAWYAGKVACSRVLDEAVGSPGDWRMDRLVANGQPAVAAYLHGRPFGVAVLDIRRDAIAGITVFGDPALVERFTLRTCA